MKQEYVNLVESSNLLEKASEYLLEGLKSTDNLEEYLNTFTIVNEGIGDTIEKYIVNNLQKVLAFLVKVLREKDVELSPEEQKLAKALELYTNSMKSKDSSFGKDPSGSLSKSISTGLGKNTGISYN